MFYLSFRDCYDISVQNKIIDSVFSVDVEDSSGSSDYSGYIYIPSFNVKRLIKSGTSSDILDNGYVGILSGDLNSSDLIILAGHNIFTVFSSLHDISNGDYVFIRNSVIDRKFIVYNKIVVSESDFSYFYNRNNELLLITCTDTAGYRLLVFLREDL